MSARLGSCGNPLPTAKRAIAPVRVDVTFWFDPERCEIHVHEDRSGDGRAYGLGALTNDQRWSVIGTLRRIIGERATLWWAEDNLRAGVEKETDEP